MTKPRRVTLPMYGLTVHIATDATSWARLRSINTGLTAYTWDRSNATIDKLPPHQQLDHMDNFPPAGHTTWSLWVPNKPDLSQQRLWMLVDVEAHHDALELVATCAHEAAHGSLSVLDHLGHHPNRGQSGNDEPTAYLVGWLTMELMRACGVKWRKLGREKLSSTRA